MVTKTAVNKAELAERLRRLALRVMTHPEDMPWNAEPLVGYLPDHGAANAEKIVSLDALDYSLPRDVPTKNIELRSAYRFTQQCDGGEELVLDVLTINSRHNGMYYIAAIDGSIICIQRPKDWRLRAEGVSYNSEYGVYE